MHGGAAHLASCGSAGSRGMADDDAAPEAVHRKALACDVDEEASIGEEIAVAEGSAGREQLLPPPPWAAPRPVGGSPYVEQYVLMGLWLLALLGGYLAQRLSCLAGLPYDCLRELAYLDWFGDMTELFMHGLVLGWFVGVGERTRFAWLFSWRRWYFWAVYLATPPAYSALSNVAPLKHSLVDFGSWGPGFIAVFSTGAALALAAICWHVRRAARRRSRPELAAYLASRLALLGYFGGSALYMGSREGVHIHLHHLYLGWSLALWSEFNAWPSGLTLALGAGVFVQGVGAYSFAPVFQSRDCFDTPSASSVACSFSGASPFVLRVCAAGGGGLPPHHCAARARYGA